MIGRRSEVATLRLQLAEGLHQFVVGPRRQGKTTVCLAAIEQLRRQRSYVVRADLFAIPTLERFAEILVDQVWANRSPGRRAAYSVGRAGRAAATVAGTAATVRLRADLGEDVELAFNPTVGRRSPRQFFEHALRLLQRIAEHDDKKVVLFLDEFQELGAVRHPYGDPDEIMNLMRSVLQVSPAVTCLFAGSVQHMMRDLLAVEHRALYQFGSWFEIGPIPEATWRKGLVKRAARAEVSFEPVALDRLIELGEHQARTTMLLAQQAYVAAVAEQRNEIDLATVEIGLVQAMRADVAAHQAVVEQIRAMGRRTLDVAVRIALGIAPYGTGSPNTAKRAIDLLAARGLIEQRGSAGRGGWVVLDPLFRRYLADMG